MQEITRRSFLKIGAVFGAGIMGTALVGCAPAANSSSSSAAEEASKVLVVYYSAQGHTKKVAETIADELKADTFELVPSQVYTADDLNYNNEQSRVSREHADESLRDVSLSSATPDNFDRYETVLVGYPIWWAIAAWPTNHFATDNNFAGKRVIPFCTSASSSLGQSAELLANAAGSGNWQDGQRFSSSATDDEVREWVKSLGI